MSPSQKMTVNQIPERSKVAFIEKGSRNSPFYLFMFYEQNLCKNTYSACIFPAHHIFVTFWFLKVIKDEYMTL